MTISYNLDVASASPLNFLKLLFRWRASIWKSILAELLIWLVCYMIVAFIYRSDLFFTKEQKDTFEHIAHHFNSRLDYIPLSLILGFFVTVIIQRWSVMFNNMGYIENQALTISHYINGTDEDTRLLRRTLCRWLCLSQALVFRDICIGVRKRFPTLEYVVKAGLLLEHERQEIEATRLRYNKYWIPIHWVTGKIVKLQKEGKISSDIFASKVVDSVLSFRDNLAQLCRFDWVPVPLAYPQVVFLSVRVYFFICLFSRQFIITESNKINKSTVDLRIPIMTMLQFIFYVGWMKVAEGLLNPFGEDDDDFECNFLIDKNFATSLCIADDAQNPQPTLMPDKFWSCTDVEAFYPKESTVSISVRPLVGSAVHARLQDDDAHVEMEPLVIPEDASELKERSNSISEGGNCGVNKRTSFKIKDKFRSISTVDRPKQSFNDPESCRINMGKRSTPSIGHQQPSEFHLSTVQEDESSEKEANSTVDQNSKEKKP